MNTKITYPDLDYPHLQQRISPLVYIAAVMTVLVSLLPDILWRETTHTSSDWLFWAKIAGLVFFILISTLWKVIQPLRSYFVVLIVLYVAEWVSGLVASTPQWQMIFNDSSFTEDMLSIQLLRLLVAFIMIATLFIIKKERAKFFLIVGNLKASVEPVPWLGVDKTVSWLRFGPIVALCISLGTLAFLVITGQPSLAAFLKVLPLLPAIVILALMNSFSEEVNYRAGLLATLDGAVSRQQALFLTAAYFGIGHFYGVPYGIIGVVMAGVLGWLLGKAMLETRGLFWPWLIHFLQDVLIFSFMTIGAIAAGGK